MLFFLTATTMHTTLSRPSDSASLVAPEYAIPHVLEELRRIAQRELARERSAHAWQRADLVQEAYLRLAKYPAVASRGKRYFCAAAARAMRQVLIDSARRRRAMRRGGGVKMIALDAVPPRETPLIVDELRDERLSLNAALVALNAHHPRYARVVACRFVYGMTVHDTAAALGVSARTVKADWVGARGWLREALRELDDRCR